MILANDNPALQLRDLDDRLDAMLARYGPVEVMIVAERVARELEDGGDGE